MTAPEALAEERLMVEAAQRDPTRFADLYEANFERVYAYCVRRVRHRQEAEDVTAEVFHQALAGLPGFQWRGIPFAAWLFRIAAHIIANRAQRAAREREVPPPEAPPAPEGEPLDRMREEARLFRLVRELPADQRRVIEMRFAQEKSIREVATELGRSEGSVKQLQLRAVRSLRARMEEAHG
ncbi:MAG TPA: sigma-70 family RNA polymerase sigma factor [Vicinamibacteria bacterium]|nr:sigma-70 family RNA polymerase sigma factor [Vicinamibacteria bacterium]